ncbi:MAG: alpha/beta fold hydrolase [Chitinophagaceae bacterium]|nr:MAG: alpha/beta fold hydrolase [Chitinophagaceae bacterium]
MYSRRCHKIKRLDHFTLKYKSSAISCHRYGNGPVAVLCFAGYGETGNAFSLLTGDDTVAFSLFCIDLPFHGSTAWNENRRLLRKDLLVIRDMVLDLHQAASGVETPSESAAKNPATPYVLMGFSLGGRVAMELYRSDPSRVSRLLLLAPDGLRFGFWFSFSTGTWIGGRVFHLLMYHRHLLPRLLSLVKKTGLIDKSRMKFIGNYLQDPESRKLVYKRWSVLGKMKPSRARLRRLVMQHHTTVRLLYGRFDRVIPAADGVKFNGTIQPHGAIIILESGHQLLVPKNRKVIVAALRE